MNKELVKNIASREEWKSAGNYILNIDEEDDLILYVECIDIEGYKKFDSIAVSLKNEDEQCALLQRISKSYDKTTFLPCNVETDLVAFENKHDVTLPTLFSFQLLRISKQFLNYIGSTDWIINIEDALVYKMRDITKDELYKGFFEKIEMDDKGGTKCMRLYEQTSDAWKPSRTFYYDLIIHGPGKGYFFQHTGFNTAGFLCPLCGEILQTKNTLDVYYGDYYDAKI